MAHLAKLGALTEELVTILTSRSAESDPVRFNLHKETALRTLRSNSYPRTNQFDVLSRLEGLEEKFRVYNEDPLADALRERLDALAKKGLKWAPDILSLLLELSDKPLSNTRLEDLEFIKEPEPDPGPALKWRDLVAEDPLLREKSVWKNVDFGAENSDEDAFGDVRSEASGLTGSTDDSSVENEYIREPDFHAVDDGRKQELEIIREAQFWKKSPSINGVKLGTVKKHVSELDAIRETLFMLNGYPTSIFEMEPGHPRQITPSSGYVLKHASNDAFHKVATDFANQGSAVMTLRSWLGRRQEVPLLQVFQGAVSKRLRDFDDNISKIQQRFVAISSDTIVSFLSIQVELSYSLRPLWKLSDIVQKLDADPYAHAFRYLEMLYDETCISQMAGDDDMYACFGKIFFECLQIYLRPLRLWMEEGELTKDDNVFFVSEIDGKVQPAFLWQSRFKIKQTQAGVLHAPRFLQPKASKIFITGKSVVVLKYLNRFRSLQSSRSSTEPKLDFETVCCPSAHQLSPFPELFDAAFDLWVQSKHQYASSTLRKALFDSCGLHISLDAMSHIYFLADGIIGGSFSSAIFDKLDTLDASWNDQFTLTELVRSTYGPSSSISSERLRVSVRSLPQKYQEVAKCRRSIKTLAVIELKYKLSWPIQIIITPTTIPSYQKILTFLLQIRRSSHILSRQRIIKDPLDKTSSTDERAIYYSLRSRLVWFTQTLYYYLTSIVIEPSSQFMRGKLREAEDVNTMIVVHEAYIKSILDQALLGSKLEPIRKTIIKILDQSIMLEDAQAANVAATKEAEDRQREMMDLSIASLGLHTPRKPGTSFKASARREQESSDEEEIDVDLSMLSTMCDEADEESYVQTLGRMKSEFDRLVRFVTSGLRAVARASGAEESRSWDVLGEMLESGLGIGVGSMGWR
ncbi:Spc98 family-domain-containing protein [Bisporella sp. PMI_857]|nr:Spc98 family-domain-containing protein [Bisporella sp. PMI_857]